MLTRDLISNSFPYLHLEDKVHHALQLMSDYHVAHLPVVDEDRYVGIVDEDQLLHSDDNQEIKESHFSMAIPSVQAGDHFLKAIQVAVDNRLSIVPVLENGQMAGVVTYTDMLRNASEFMSLKDPGALIVLELEGKDYSFSEVNRIVESNDAQITQLNSFIDTETGLMQLTIRVNKMDVSNIISSFQRYEYIVKHYFGEELYENELRSNYDNLMNYLNI